MSVQRQVSGLQVITGDAALRDEVPPDRATTRVVSRGEHHSLDWNADLSHLVTLIYEATIDFEQWPLVLGEIAARLNSATCALHILDPERHTVIDAFHHGAIDLAVDGSLSETGILLRCVQAGLASWPVGHPMLLKDVLAADGRMTRRDGPEPSCIDYLGLVALRSGSRLVKFSAMRFGRGAEYGRAEAAVLEALAPHLCQAVRIMQAFDRSTAVAQSAHATMELQAVPICLVAGDGRVAQQNEAMVRLLASTSALQSIDGRLIATDRRAQAALQVAIAAADGRGIGRGQEQTNRCIALPGSPSGGLIAYVAALPRGSSGLLREGFAVAAIFVCDMSTAAAPPREGFAELFQLTRREMELLTRLLPGYTLPELAHSMGVSLPTVKTHLAHIFGKTGTSRQAELVALAMRATPPIAMP